VLQRIFFPFFSFFLLLLTTATIIHKPRCHNHKTGSGHLRSVTWKAFFNFQFPRAKNGKKGYHLVRMVSAVIAERGFLKKQRLLRCNPRMYVGEA